MFKMHTAIKHFTPLFECMFLAPSSCSSSDMLYIMSVSNHVLNDKQRLVLTFLQGAVNQLVEGVYIEFLNSIDRIRLSDADYK